MADDLLDHAALSESEARTDPLAVGRRLRDWRFRRRLTQGMVARRAGISQGALSNYEAGRRELTVGTSLRLVAALEISLNQLLPIEEVILVRDSAIGVALESGMPLVLRDSPSFV